MPEKGLFADIPAWAQAIVAALGGFLSALALALINRGPALQTIVQKHVESLLSADAARMQQMSAVLAENSKKLDQLRASVDVLARHISTLEELLASAGVEAPPRPMLGIAET